MNRRADLDTAALADWISGMAEGIAARGGGTAGDKTMLDAWLPAAEAAQTAAGSGLSEAECLRVAYDAAQSGADATRALTARKGRAAKLGDRSLGHPDPGAVSAALVLKAMRSAMDP